MQQNFTDIEYSCRKKATRREKFLHEMDKMVPWADWIAMIEPFYPSGRRGRPTRGIEIMLRMYMLQNWFNLADEALEDAIYMTATHSVHSSTSISSTSRSLTQQRF